MTVTANHVFIWTELEVALFARRPQLGEVNPPGEIAYAGYTRVPFGLTSLKPLVFPPSQQAEPVFAACAVLLDAHGAVQGVALLDASNLLQNGTGVTMRMTTQ